ncbi:MAG TPA: DUF995 domain-containing protein [Oxalicibacterium sp.]
MSRFRLRAGILGAATLVTLAGSACSVSAQESTLPAAARIMTPAEIHELYRDKSWQWKSGAGYTIDAGRQFSAWVDDENGKSWAEGRWIITETGRMCFNATWHSIDGAFPAKTCFSHRIDNGTIYQKREPAGDWYVFHHAEPRDEDEASKLVGADLVSAQIATVKTALDSTQFSEQ